MKQGILVVMLAGAVVVSGCANMSEEQRSGTGKGAAIGAATGAVLGAITGSGTKGAVRGAAVGAAAGALGGYVWSSRMEEQRRQMEASTRGTGVEVTQTADNQLKLNIPSDISFDSGRSDIRPNFRTVLDSFAQGLLNNPQAHVRIVGHTDNVGSDSVNDPLSLSRAASVRSYLVSRGVSPGVISIDGRGEREPIASNESAEGRARNRRVEIFMSEGSAR